MLHQNLLRRSVQLGACAAALVLGTSAGQAATGGSCGSAYRNAETLAKAGQLREAKASMLKCAVGSCASSIRKECARRVTEIESDIPTIVPLVLDEKGQTLTEVSVTMDGELVAARTDGRAVPVDPGRHEFVFQTKGAVIATHLTVVVQGQRNRTIEISLRPGQEALAKSSVPTLPAPGALAPASMVQAVEDDMVEPSVADAPPRRGRSFTPTTLILAGGAVLGASGYLLTTYLGNQDADELDACRPTCDPDKVDQIRNYYLAGKISLGLGVAALAGATYFYLTSASDRAPPRAMAATAGGYRVDVLPASSGGMAVLSGSF
jgi:hypothetical protein